MTQFTLVSAFVFILGTVFGSFFNVCIHRLPREEAVAWPPSRCPKCKKPIAWFDNIPLLSVFLLKGRCRHCGTRIAPRYFVVELITGIFYLWIWFYFGWTVKGFVSAILFSLLLIATVVDLEHQIIPDEISLGGLALGLVLSPILPSIHGETIWWHGLLASTIGALVGGGMIYATGVIGTFIFKKDAMGGGDVKLLAMLGAFLGWEKVVVTYLLAPILALPLGLFLKFVRRAEVIAYGPFLSLAGWMCFLWGDQFITWYFRGMMY
ncbi:MAG: prepilin peptidase [Candidatus Omnitrophica bacterium]|nr:prepilin peptidase [Candidatus Omnitrophota bacterium]